MSAMPPRWALERAYELYRADPRSMDMVFANYIAAHEDAPATPRDLIAEAVTVGDAYAAADRAIKALQDAGFQIVRTGAA